MRSFSRRFLKSASIVLIFVFMTVQFTACSGGGGNSEPTPPGDNLPRLVQSACYPGQFLTIEQDTAAAGQIIPVTFQDLEYSVTVDAVVAQDGVIQVPAPPYFSAGGSAAAEGTVSVSLPGSLHFADLRIEAPPALAYPGEARPGYYLRWWLSANAQSDAQIIDNAGLFQSDSALLQSSLLSRMQLGQEAMDEYDQSGTFTIRIRDLGDRTLSEDELRLADQLLYSYCAGVLDALAPQAASVFIATSTRSRGQAANPTQQEVLQILSDTRDALQRAMSQADAGTQILIGFASALAALGVLIFAGKFALVVGALCCLGYMLSAGIHSEGMAWLSSRLSSQLGDAWSESYTFGTQLWNHFCDAAASFGSNLVSGVNSAGDLLNDLYTSLSTLEAERELICSTQPQPQKLDIPRGMSALVSIEQFCLDTQVDPLQVVFSSTPDALDVNQSGVLGITISGGKPIYKIDLDWGDDVTLTRYLTQPADAWTHAYAADGTYRVSLAVMDIAGQTATAGATIKVGTTTLQTTVTFQDMWGVYTVTLTFPGGQAGGHTIRHDTEVYNTDELVEIQLPDYPADPNLWPVNTVPLQAAVSGADFQDWLFYSNISKSDWTRRTLITHMTDEVQAVSGSRYYFIVIYPATGPYRTVAFRLVGTAM